MSYMVMLWIVWIVIGLVLLGLILHRVSLNQYKEDQLCLENETQHRLQGTMLAKGKRFEHAIRIFGGIEGVVTLAIVAFYLLDALRQF